MTGDYKVTWPGLLKEYVESIKRIENSHKKTIDYQDREKYLYLIGSWSLMHHADAMTNLEQTDSRLNLKSCIFNILSNIPIKDSTLGLLLDQFNLPIATFNYDHLMEKVSDRAVCNLYDCVATTTISNSIEKAAVKYSLDELDDKFMAITINNYCCVPVKGVLDNLISQNSQKIDESTFNKVFQQVTRDLAINASINLEFVTLDKIMKKFDDHSIFNFIDFITDNKPFYNALLSACDDLILDVMDRYYKNDDGRKTALIKYCKDLVNELYKEAYTIAVEDNQAKEQVEDQVKDQVKDQVEEQVKDQVKDHVSKIIHLHGSLHDIKGNDFVLTRSEYKQTNTAFQLAMSTLFKDKELIFVGVGDGLFDMHMVPFLRSRNESTTSYWLVKESDVNKSKLKLEAYKIENVEVKSYGRDYSDLQSYLNQLLALKNGSK